MGIMTSHNVGLSRWWILLYCLQSLLGPGQCGCPFGFGPLCNEAKSKWDAPTTVIVDKQQLMMSPSQAKAYLLQYGYIDTCSSSHIDTEDDLRYAIVAFQQWANLNLTSELDNDTLAMMGEARCGNKDVLMEGEHVSDEVVWDLFDQQGEQLLTSQRRRKRYILQGSRWKKRHLTYSIESYTSDLPTSDIERTIGQAFQVWSDVTPLTFTYSKCKPVDIEIHFTRAYHNDGNPFDGPGGVLAHAFYPFSNDESRDGDLHFDDAEKWVLGNNLNGTNLLYVAVHELGHSLGLEHSQVYDSIMWPWASSKLDAGAYIQLHPDDIDAIQEIYGTLSGSHGDIDDPLPSNCTIWRIERNSTEYAWNTSSLDTSTWSNSNWNTTSWNTSDWNSPRWNTSFWNTSDDNVTTRVYKGMREEEITTDADNVPERSTMTTTENRDWLPDWTLPVIRPVKERCSGRIDAITAGPDNQLYAFRDDKLYVMAEHGIKTGYPKPIGHVFPGGPNKVDAAFSIYYGRVSKTYLIQGDQCWRYSSTWGHIRLDGGYPRHIRDAFGIKSLYVDAVFRDFKSKKNKVSFIFLTGDTYWEVNFHKRGNVKTKHRPLRHHRLLHHLPPIHAAFRESKGGIYFFTADSYYRYTWYKRLTKARDTARLWFGCSKTITTDSYDVYYGAWREK